MTPLRNSVQQFARAMRQRITPGVRYHQDAFVEVLWTHVPAGGHWLDLGCGHQLLPSWQSARERDLIARAGVVVGLDYDLESVRRHSTIAYRCRGDIGSLPFESESFDLVTANMVVEHLDHPERQFREVARVLRPGGIFLYHTPNADNYQVRIARLVPRGSRACWRMHSRDGTARMFSPHTTAPTPQRTPAVLPVRRGYSLIASTSSPAIPASAWFHRWPS